jgi:hypothetical protein
MRDFQQEFSSFDTQHQDAVALFGEATQEERGAIYTKREVVDFILDLVGYHAGESLVQMRLLEPSCGGAEFLVPAVERLLGSIGGGKLASGELLPCIRAYDVSSQAVRESRNRVKTVLCSAGMATSDAQKLVETWIKQADFLMEPLPYGFTHVVGNPPYIRQEAIPDQLLKSYRERYTSIYDRADIYVPFIERSLSLLDNGGRLGFICSDRWMKNRYGGPLRQIVANDFHLQIFVDMTSCPAFDSEVVAYPAITVIERGPRGATRAAYRPEINAGCLRPLADGLLGKCEHKDVYTARDVVSGPEPWLLDDFLRLKVIRLLEAKFATLEEAGCMVGIGVATGADRVYIGDDKALAVESSRKLPLVTTKDVESGELVWNGNYVINPFLADGSLAALEDYPRFARHLETHRDVITRRNVAKRNTKNWYRTIDRIDPELLAKEKLLIPDIKGKAHVVYDEGKFYPHHNLYYILSEDWDLRALQAILLSRVAQAFVATYSLRMRGDFLRFQAQYLRRIRLPMWKDVPKPLKQQLHEVGRRRDISACDKAAQELYGIDSKSWDALLGHNYSP